MDLTPSLVLFYSIPSFYKKSSDFCLIVHILSNHLRKYIDVFSQHLLYPLYNQTAKNPNGSEKNIKKCPVNPGSLGFTGKLSQSIFEKMSSTGKKDYSRISVKQADCYT
jgi:hypothetical protein